MNFDSTISERDPGVKVIDFQITAESGQIQQSGALIAEMEQLLAEIKQQSSSNSVGPQQLPNSN